MNRPHPTPEEVILGSSYSEIMELLADLGMNASCDTAMRLKQLVRMLRDFERALEMLTDTNQQRRAA